MNTHDLRPEERELFGLVAQASVANQFSAEREQLDRRIAGVGKEVAFDDLLGHVRARVGGMLDVLRAEGRYDIRQYGGRDRELVELTLLFDLFHEYMPLFDRLIERQADELARPPQVRFADKVLTQFDSYGFSRDEALVYFAIFFQLRRAYYFIVQRLVGSAPCMQKLRTDLWYNVFTIDQPFYKRCLMRRMEDFSTLLLGGTGTGKGTAAAAIGRSGFIPFDPQRGTFEESFTRAFVAINLSQYPPGLIESELFGHRKGAFTGAVESHDGVFSRCSPHGSIFLDEIGDVEVPLQIKLLQVLQERTFTPVGSHERRRFSGRVIAATNRDIGELRREKRFRDDFYYRLCSDVIVMPSLQQRIAEDPGELDALIRHLVRHIAGVDEPTVAARVRAVIDRRLGPTYPWPGNVRELEQCVRRVLLRNDYEGDRRAEAGDTLGRLLDDIRAETIDASALLARYCLLLYERHGTYEAVAAISGLDRRTVKKYVDAARE
ncbi:MAG: sigma-54-dependent Fis family transcriptional regulator [Chitinivibrionales bacterium]|nr:sigma-54-dependent Fis family transcriptional regulator [Chitinivibrionales bacterium]